VNFQVHQYVINGLPRLLPLRWVMPSTPFLLITFRSWPTSATPWS